MNDSAILQVLKGQGSPAEAQALAAWRRSAPEAEQRYQELARLVALLEARSRVESRARPVPSALALIHRAEERASRQRWRPWVASATAAAALLVLAIGWERLRDRPGTKPDLATEEFVTGAGELATARLGDGSVVRLAPRTQLRVISWGRERQVSLTGRAFFAVAAHQDRPFRVLAGAAEAVVLGTRFEIETSNDDLRLLVVEGRVALTASQGTTREVAAGNEARVVDGTASPAVRVQNPGDRLRWVGRFLAFQNTPLDQVIADIGRLYPVRIELGDPALAVETVTAWFVDRPLDEVIQSVCLALSVSCVHQAATVVIGK
jgi:ferric-dicitrate binding protein FerR (iron transport regulator)